VELEIACGAAAEVVPAQVLQVFPGQGVAVSVEPAARATIEGLILIADLASSEPAPAGEDEPSGTTTIQRTGPRPGQATLEKIQRALKGDRDERMAVLRDINRTLHVHVLRNPGITIDEIATMAKMTTISVDALRQIADRKEWGQRPEIAIALVRNPTVPPPVAIRLLDHVSQAELRQLAKDSRTREPIQKAARRKVMS
jgi:hypothetical protein